MIFQLVVVPRIVWNHVVGDGTARRSGDLMKFVYSGYSRGEF